MLLAILAEHSISVNYEAVASRLGCAPGAVRERIKKLKKTNSNPGGENDSTSPAKSATQTPSSDAKANGARRRKIATPRAPKASKGRSGKVKEEIVLAESSLDNTEKEGDMEGASGLKYEPSVEEDDLMFSDLTYGMENSHEEDV